MPETAPAAPSPRSTGRLRSAGLLLLLCTALFPAAPARAAEDPAKPENTEPQLKETLTVNETPLLVPETNTVATKLPVANQLTPASVSVVAAPLLERQDARTLSDALKNVSGVSVHSESGVADFFLVRGFDSETSGLVLTDGTPEPEVTRYQLYNADRVEVLKGPASFLYGGNPLAGAVNIVRKQPLPYDLVQVDGSAGSFGTHQGKVDANWSGADDKVGLRVNGLWEETDGWRDGRSGRANGVNPTLTFRPAADQALTVSYEHVKDDFAPDAGLPVVFGKVADVPLRRSYQSPFDFSDQKLDRAHLDWEGKWGGFTLRNKAYWNRLDWRTDGTLFAGVFPGPTGSLDVSRILTLLDDRQDFLGDQLEGVFSFATGAVEHRLLTGIELARRDDTFTLDVGFLPGIDLFAPVETARQPVPLIPGQSQAGDARTTLTSPYVLDSIGFGKGGKRFQLLVGGRYDHSDYKDDASGTKRTDSQFSPLFGAVYAPSEQVSLYVNAGRGFAPPSTRVVGPRRPETGNQVEAGIKGDFLGGRLRASLAAYRIERRNEPIPDATGFTVQNGSERSQGFELEVAGEPLPRLFALFSYAYDDATFTRFDELALVSFFPPTFAVVDRAGNNLPLAPEHIANLWLTRRLGDRLEASLGGRYVSRQFIAADNAFAIPAAFTADAALSYQVGRFRAHLNAKNLTGKKTYTRGFGSSSVIPAPGFGLYAGIEVRWAPSAPRDTASHEGR
jgi:iron complex outermembrane recepter protein